MQRYVLELNQAEKVDTGRYKWSFGQRNQRRPKQVNVGPVSVTCETDQRRVIIKSSTFAASDLQSSLRGDSPEAVLRVVQPSTRTLHAPDTASGGASNVPVGTGSDAAIEAMHDAGRLLCWTDFDPTRMFDGNFQNVANPGDQVNTIYDRKNASLIWQLAYGSHLVAVKIGEAWGVSKVGSWQSVVDTSPLPANFNVPDEFTIHFLMQVRGANDYSMPLFFTNIKFGTYQGAFVIFKTATNHIAHPVQGLQMLPLRPYLISISRSTESGAPQFVYRVENLTDGTVQTATGDPTAPTITQSPTWRLNHAGASFHHYHSAMIVHTGRDADDMANAQSWIRNLHAGGATDAPGGSGSDAAASATQWYRLFDPRTTEITMQPGGFSDVFDELVVDFVGHDGAPLDPKDCCLQLSLIE